MGFQTSVTSYTFNHRGRVLAMSQSCRNVIPVMNLLQEMREQDFQVICTKPHMYCKVFEDNSGALELARLPKLDPRTKHINVCYHHFCKHVRKGLIKIFPVDTKDQIADPLTKLWHKTSFNVIAATCVASNLHKQPKWGSVTYLEYFGTYLGYLSTNPMSQHSDTLPANPRLNPRHSTTLLIAELVLFLLRNS